MSHIFLHGLTPLPIELTCKVTGVVAWIVNDITYTLGQLNNGALPGHSRTGTNIFCDLILENRPSCHK